MFIAALFTIHITFKEPLKHVLKFSKCHHKILNASYIQEFFKYINDFQLNLVFKMFKLFLSLQQL